MVSEYIEVLINKQNLKKMSLLIEKNINIGDVIQIPIDKLPMNSHYKINTECDYCGKVLKMAYKDYNNYLKVINKISCSHKECVSKKIKDVYLKKYNVEHHMLLETSKEKVKQTNINKYGKNYSNTNEFKEKVKKTSLEKYHVDNYSKTKECKQLVKETNLQKYGVDNYTKTEQYNIITRKTNLEKYGNEYYSQTDESKKRIKKTNLEKYGVTDIFKQEEYRIANFKIAQHTNYIKYIVNGISLFNCDCRKEHQFEIKCDNFLKRIQLNLPLCTICYPIGEQKSIKEVEILNFIKEIYAGEIIDGYREQLEIDIYLPELKLGFEFNGLYWHSEEYKYNNYHLNKTLYFKEKGIRIIHIFEDDWDSKKDIIKSQIKNYLGLTKTKIFARKCQIKEIQSSEFLDVNHIQGNVKSVIKLGLYYNEELVSLMTFDQFEGRKKMLNAEYNLSRFCNLLNTNVIGGASKLLNYFIKTYNPSRIISYADRSWSEGNLYYQLGFKLISESKPIINIL